MSAKHPVSTAALILAVLALFMALGGPSYATSVVKRAVNADKFDGLHASKTPKAKRLLPLTRPGQAARLGAAHRDCGRPRTAGRQGRDR